MGRLPGGTSILGGRGGLDLRSSLEAKFGVFVTYTLEAKSEAPTRISEANFGAKPPRPPNMEVPPGGKAHVFSF